MDQIRESALEGHNRPRNPGAPLDPGWFEAVGVNASAVERRAATLTTRRSVKKEYQAAWLVQAADLHRPDDARRRRHAGPRAAPLRQGAQRPLSDDLLAALGLGRRSARGRRGLRLSDHGRPPAVKALEGSGIPVASVATGFPAGLTPLPQRLDEIRYAVERGRAARSTSSSPARMCSTATGTRSTTRCAAMREACGAAHLKAILAHRRPQDFAQRLCREHGRDAGGRRLHQDLDRQGGRQRDAAGQPRDGARAARLSRARRRRHRLQAGRRPCAPRRTRWTG